MRQRFTAAKWRRVKTAALQRAEVSGPDARTRHSPTGPAKTFALMRQVHPRSRMFYCILSISSLVVCFVLSLMSFFFSLLSCCLILPLSLSHTIGSSCAFLFSLVVYPTAVIGRVGSRLMRSTQCLSTEYSGDTFREFGSRIFDLAFCSTTPAPKNFSFLCTKKFFIFLHQKISYFQDCTTKATIN